MISGILLVDKPKGLTSHDVVDIVRRSIGQKKVGHSGTLDPMATGLLVVLLGKATRLLPFLNNDKVYEGTIHFGITTDTLDGEGRELKRVKCKLDQQQVEKIANSFLGSSLQLPPMVSAVKVKGEPLYKSARAGKVIKREKREINISELKLFSFDHTSEYPSVDFRVGCSGGTYIRSLAADIGEMVGCGAHLSRLRRTKAGSFKLDDATGIDELEKLENESSVQRMIIPLHRAVDLPEIVVDDTGATDMSCGRAITSRNVRQVQGDFSKGSFLKVTEADHLLGIAIASISRDELDGDPDIEIARPKTVFEGKN